MDVRAATGLAPQSSLPEAMFGKTYTKLRLSAISRLLAEETRFANSFPQKSKILIFFLPRPLGVLAVTRRAGDTHQPVMTTGLPQTKY